MRSRADLENSNHMCMSTRFQGGGGNVTLLINAKLIYIFVIDYNILMF